MPFFDPIRIGASGAADTTYTVDRSLRFNDDDTAYLERNVTSSSNRKTHTFSTWIKRCEFGDYHLIYTQGDNAGNEMFYMFFNNNDQIEMQQYDYPANQGRLTTTQKFRDPSAWYHIVMRVDTTNSTADDRFRIYVNGEQITSFGTRTNPSQNLDTWINDTTFNFRIGATGYNGMKMDGYMTEINFIDGLSLAPSSFGETDSITGQWNPKKYVGSYGTNGFYLPLSDNSGTTATTLGKDSSGNGNNFTPNNFSVSAGTGNDSLEDTPTNNFPTLNPLNSRVPARLSNGNLDIDYTNSDDNASAVGSFGMKSGKWYFEVTLRGDSSSMGASMIGISPDSYLNLKRNNVNAWGGLESGSGIGFNGNNEVYYNGSSTGYGGTWATNDIIGIAVDADLGKVAVSKNGQFSNGSGSYNQGSTIIDAANKLITNATKVDTDAPYFVSLADTSGAQDPKFSINFGQRAFSYTPPTGYKKLCSANLPDPTIKLPNKHFNTLLYTGDGSSTRTLTGVGFKPDWTWKKERNQAYSIGHMLYDSVRGLGVDKHLDSSTNLAEGSGNDAEYGYFTGFTSDGFSVSAGSSGDDYVNDASNNYVTWNWNAGDTDGKTYTVTVVSDSGNKYRFDGFGTSAVTLDLAEGGTYIFDQSDSSNAGHPLRFSTTSDGTHGSGSEYTTGVTTAGTPGSSGAYTQIVVAASAPTLYYYCSVHSGMGGQANTNSTLGSSNFDGSIQSTVKANASSGFSIGLFTGTGSNASIGHGLGVAPSVVIAKSRSHSDNWFIYHKSLGANAYIMLNSTNAADTNNSTVWQNVSPTSSVFYASTGGYNDSGQNLVFYAFSEVAGYSKFGSYTGNGSSDGTFVFTGFRPAWVMYKCSSHSTDGWYIQDSTRSPHNVTEVSMRANSSSAESGENIGDMLSNGFKIRIGGNNNFNGTGRTYVYMAFAESPFKNSRAR